MQISVQIRHKKCQLIAQETNEQIILFVVVVVAGQNVYLIAPHY